MEEQRRLSQKFQHTSGTAGLNVGDTQTQDDTDSGHTAAAAAGDQLTQPRKRADTSGGQDGPPPKKVLWIIISLYMY